jgi:CheY-like chemotaxis protein
MYGSTMMPAPPALGPILIVEDDPDLLADAGYRVEIVDSAFGTATLIRRERPAAILLDLELPFRPGTAHLDELTADPRTAAIPIIILSANHALLPDARRPQAAAVLAKPFDAAELLRVLAEVVGEARAPGTSYLVKSM